MKKFLKHGGSFREVLENVKSSNSFIVPKGCKIDSIITSKKDTDAVTLGLGTTESTVEKNVITVTGAPTADGTITVAGVAVEILDADTVEGVAQKIATALAAASIPWTVAYTAGTAIVTLTATVEGNVTNATYVDTDTTATTMTIVATPAGTLPADVMTAALSAVAVAKQTVLVSLFSVTADTPVYINLSNNIAEVDLYVQMSKFN